ncbi:MAG: hypothetical protein IJK02_01205 [Clostridia bacterium]|nr:hypothetical protein [Clostridia bacterium]
MKEKLLSVFFSTISWIVWAAVMCLIGFMVSVFFVGDARPPVFEVSGVRISQAGSDDAVLSEHAADPAGWYKVEIDAGVTGAALSPYTYRASEFELKAPLSLRNSPDQFTVLDAPLTYSKASPDSFLLTFYVRYNGSTEDLKTVLKETRFRMVSVEQSFAFLSWTYRTNMPILSLSQFPEAIDAA